MIHPVAEHKNIFWMTLHTCNIKGNTRSSKSVTDAIMNQQVDICGTPECMSINRENT